MCSGSGSARIGGEPIPEVADLGRLRSARHTKLQRELEAQGLDGLFLLTTSAVVYATGALAPGADSGRASLLRPAAAVVRGDPVPHVFTAHTEGVPPDLPDDHVHPPLYPDLDQSVEHLAEILGELFGPGARIGVDDQPFPLLAAAERLPGRQLVAAAGVMGAAKIAKTGDELACIRMAQYLNELAIREVQRLIRPGCRQNELTARFLRRVFELGASANGIDPIWQVMPLRKADGPWTVHGDLAFPTPSTDRLLRDGDTIWVDTGISYEGYASDFGRTWLVGWDPRPTPRQRRQYERWHDVVDAVLGVCKPGVTALELNRAAVSANAGHKPWIQHFYLAHGVGTDNAEMPLIGTDLGEAFEEQLVLAPGMVLVLEPVIWDDGAAGYRAEDIVAVTDDGWVALSDYPYDPYGGAP